MNPRKAHRRIAAHYAWTPSGMIPWAVVTIDAQGTIIGMDSRARVDSHYGVEFYSGVLIPGMVNAHTHLELSCLRGEIPPGGGFRAFAEGLGAARDNFSAGRQLAAAAFHDARMWAEGVGAAGDISNGTMTYALKRRSRIAYHTFLELYGLGRSDADCMAPASEEALAAGLAASITPHSTYSLNEAAFAAAAGEGSGPLSVHFMESRAEAELYGGRGDLHEWYTARGFRTDFTGKYASPADRIIAHIPGNRRIMLIHNTFVNEADVQKLNSHFGGNLTWVLCPRSNLHITGAMPPCGTLRRAGCRIAVGTDSLASNTSLSMVEELKTFTGVPLPEMVEWATLSGAQALGMDGVYGSFETGKTPGIVLLEGVDSETMELTPGASTRRLA